MSASEGTQRGVPLAAALAAVLEPQLAALRAPLNESTPSDATFSNLLLFRDAHDYRYCRGPWPYIDGRAYDGAHILIPLFALSAAPLEALRELQGTDGWFFPVAEQVLGAFDAAAIEQHALREDADYLYRASAFLDYEGAGLGAKRHGVERLLAHGPVAVHPLGPAMRDAALAVLEGWRLDKALGPQDADVRACRAALDGLGTANPLRGFLHESAGVPAGFVLVEDLNPGVVAVRFAKGRTAVDGIYAHLFQNLARQLAPAVQWLNFEQDLGKPNFRRSKESFRPAMLLSKYRVRIREA